jgi:hypothetical protein
MFSSFARRLTLRRPLQQFRLPSSSARLFAGDVHASVAEYEARQAEKRREASTISPEKEALGYEPGFFEKNGLNKWAFMVPTSIAIFFPFMENQWFMINEEVSLAIAWAMFCGGVYVKFGDTIANMFQEARQEVIDQQTGYEGAVIDALKEMIEASESELDSVTTFDAVMAETRALEQNKAKAEVNEALFAQRTATLRRLDALIAAEETAIQSLKQEMIDHVVAHTTNHFQSSKKSREEVMKNAIAALSKGNTLGTDVVGTEMSKGLKSYQKEAQSGENPALKQLKQQVQTILNSS